MKLARVAVDLAGGAATALDLNPRVTVVSGLDPAIRDGMAQLVLAALGTSAPGYHAEATTVSGQYVAVFRPHGSAHQAIDVTNGRDVTAELRTSDGWIDLLAAEPGPGLDGDERVAWLWLADPDLDVEDPAQTWLTSLVGRDGDAVVRSATEAVAAERRLADAVNEAKAAAGPAAAAGEAWTDAVSHAIEARPEAPSGDGSVAGASRDAVALARARHDRMRRITLWTGLGLPVAALASLVVVGPVVALVLIVAAILIAAACLFAENRLKQAMADAEAAVQAAPHGDVPSSNGHAERALPAANGGDASLRADAEAARAALESWSRLAGEVPASWVSEHAAEVRVATASAPDGVPSASSRAAARRVLGVARRATALRGRLDPAATVPLLVSDPLDGLDEPARRALGQYLVDVSQRQQIVVLSDDPATVEWATAMAAATGAVGVVDLSQTVAA